MSTGNREGRQDAGLSSSKKEPYMCIWIVLIALVLFLVVFIPFGIITDLADKRKQRKAGAAMIILGGIYSIKWSEGYRIAKVLACEDGNIHLSKVGCVKRTILCSRETDVRELAGVQFEWLRRWCVSRTLLATQTHP